MQSNFFNFKTTTIRAGQPYRYADTVYEYEVETDQNERRAEAFCKSVLHPCRFKHGEAKTAAEHFSGYYDFTKIAQNRYRYTVTVPNCD